MRRHVRSAVLILSLIVASTAASRPRGSLSILFQTGDRGTDGVGVSSLGPPVAGAAGEVFVHGTTSALLEVDGEVLRTLVSCGDPLPLDARPDQEAADRPLRRGRGRSLPVHRADFAGGAPVLAVGRFVDASALYRVDRRSLHPLLTAADGAALRGTLDLETESLAEPATFGYAVSSRGDRVTVVAPVLSGRARAAMLSRPIAGGASASALAAAAASP